MKSLMDVPMKDLSGVVLVTVLMAPGFGSVEAQTLLIDAVVEWLEPLLLEETPAALNARPRLALDPGGGYLVTDNMMGQVRVYDADGSLLLYFGRDGDGPGEFRRLSGVARLSSGEFCTVDFEGRLAIWSPSGELINDFRLPIRGAMGVAALAGSEVAVVTSPVAAWADSLDVPWVRIIDLESPTIGEELLTLPLSEENVLTASSVAGQLNPTLGSRFGLTWSVFDSLWVVDLDEPSLTGAFQLESSALGLNTRWVDRFMDREGFVEWMLAATFPGAVYAAPGGGWLVSLYRFRRRDSVGSPYGLLRVDENGRRIWEVETSPRLVATDPEMGVLYFEETSGLLPNRFERATLRR